MFQYPAVLAEQANESIQIQVGLIAQKVPGSNPSQGCCLVYGNYYVMETLTL